MMNTGLPQQGTHVGDYLIEQEIGRGGMGVVYRATAVATGEPAAIKLMSPELSQNSRYRERFRREAELMPRIGHPNIVRIFEIGESGDTLYIAMELIEGDDLRALVEKSGPLSIRRALRLFAHAAGALDAAHEAGVVHRDVKPQNILVRAPSTPSETAVLTDFGLVKPVSSESTATKTGQIFGSVPYIAPEMIEGIPADGRADVYSLGCVLFECLTGQVPFERNNEVAALWAHIHEKPPLVTSLRKDLPPGVDDVILRALAKHPEDRHLTCGEMVEDLEQSLGRSVSRLVFAPVRPLVARVPRKKTERDVWSPNFFPEMSRVRHETRQKVPVKQIAAVAAALVLLSGVQLGREGGIPRAVTDVAAAAEATGTNVVDRLLGRNTKPIADDSAETPGHAAARQRLPQAAQKTTSRGNKQTLATDVGDEPEQVGITAAEDLHQSRSWSNGGIVFTDSTSSGNDIFILRGSGSVQNLTNSSDQEQAPAVSPDGRWIAFESDRLSTNPNRRFDIYIMRIGGGDLRRLTPDAAYDISPRWSPRGDSIIYASYPDRRCVTRDCNVSQRGAGQIRKVDLATGSIETVIADGTNQMPDWSSRGRIAFVRGGDIFTARSDGTSLERLTSTVAPEAFPRFSPDGRTIAYTTANGVHTIGARGLGLRTVASHTGAEHGAAAWAPDGTALVYSRCVCPDRTMWTFWVVGVGGGAERRVAGGYDDPTVDWQRRSSGA